MFFGKMIDTLWEKYFGVKAKTNRAIKKAIRHTENYYDEQEDWRTKVQWDEKPFFKLCDVMNFYVIEDIARQMKDEENDDYPDERFLIACRELQMKVLNSTEKINLNQRYYFSWYSGSIWPEEIV